MSELSSTRKIAPLRYELYHKGMLRYNSTSIIINASQTTCSNKGGLHSTKEDQEQQALF